MKPPPPQHTTPCANCPFSRQCEPGALGGSNPSTYIGQVRGPFWLPCHSTHDHTQDTERRNPDNPQCAGAAIFRANTGVIDQMPPQLLHLKPDTEKVFATFAEFLAHHAMIELRAASMCLDALSPEEMMVHEMKRSGVQPVNLPKEKSMNPITIQPSSRHKNSLAATLSRIGIGDDSELHFYLTIMLHPATPEGVDEKVDPPTAVLNEADFISALKLLYPQPAAVTSTDNKPPVALSTLKPGSIFERRDGGRYVKGRFRDGATRYCCIGLANGDEARVSGEEMVRETVVTLAKADCFGDWLKTVLGGTV